jgi:hypothetical protein
LSIETSETYDYIVVGSGAGGGPLAANLVVQGYRVLLIEAGSDPESYHYQVPSFHALSTEDEEMAWKFFVHHYDTGEQRATAVGQSLLRPATFHPARWSDRNKGEVPAQHLRATLRGEWGRRDAVPGGDAPQCVHGVEHDDQSGWPDDDGGSCKENRHQKKQRQHQAQTAPDEDQDVNGRRDLSGHAGARQEE